jgi:predicted nucleic acid-binding protein
VKTFLDSGVLLTAWRGEEAEMTAALSVIGDPARTFLTAETVKLELLPKPSFFKLSGELKFYGEFFSTVKAEEPLTHELGQVAFALAKKHGLAAMDALNLAAAMRLGAQEFVTTETSNKPMFRVPGLKVVSLFAAGSK